MINDFPIVKKGYDPYTVETYLTNLQETLKNYQQKDNVINNAIVSAQVAADNIIHEANVKSAKMLADTEAKLEQMQNLLSTQANIIKTFENDYKELVKKYLSNFDANDVLKISSKINNIGEKINSLKFSSSPDSTDDTTTPNNYSKLNFNNQSDNNFSKLNFNNPTENNSNFSNLNFNPTDNNFSNLNFNNSDNNSANFSNLNFNNPTDNNSAN